MRARRWRPVRWFVRIGCGAAALLPAALYLPAHAQSAAEPPSWAFAVNPPGTASPPERDPSVDRTPRHVPHSRVRFTTAQIGDLFRAVDWHPQDHPAMPAVVARGRPPQVYACGYCHLPNGLGRPENASLAGLPVEYILAQVADFSSGRRHSSEPRHLPTALMAAAAPQASDAELLAAARYFAALNPKVWIRVLESPSVPRMRVAGWMLVPAGAGAGAGESEPIGERIVETPQDLERTELRDDRSGFIAYVPPGSIARGRLLVERGPAGRTSRCAGCHGVRLAGRASVPPLAGRSPSYLVRQLYDLQSGARAGANAQPMAAVVAPLRAVDMRDIAAFIASLPP